MVFLISFFPSTGSDMDVTFRPSTKFITVGIEFKYSFTLKPKKIVKFQQYKITSDTDVTEIWDSLK